MWKNGSKAQSIQRYFRQVKSDARKCPKVLMYQLEDNFTMNISNQCCYKLKKDVANTWQEKNNRTITITGMRQEEGGNREHLNCIITNNNGNVEKFHPLSVVSENFIDWYINSKNIRLCELYYPPYNFKRTGCKGCPYSLDLQRQLDIMAIYLPNEKKQCELIWKPVYEEYRRIGYRLNVQLGLFD